METVGQPRGRTPSGRPLPPEQSCCAWRSSSALDADNSLPGATRAVRIVPLPLHPGTEGVARSIKGLRKAVQAPKHTPRIGPDLLEGAPFTTSASLEADSPTVCI